MSGLAEPMSQSLYTITESTLIISIGNLSTSCNAKSVLPEAVGPNKKTIGFLLLIFIKRLRFFHQF
tara:strand:+ start:762 stop:959 length:198 start_codon:yes stop_codon:yes gene_type:complete